MVCSPGKVMLYLMFGVASLFAGQLIKLTGYPLTIFWALAAQTFTKGADEHTKHSRGVSGKN
jgi:hypothetical protein